MQHLVIQSQICAIGLAGRIYSDPARPALLIVGGSFAPKDFMHDYIDLFGGATVLVASFPGMATPWMSPSLAQIRQSFDEVIGDLLGDRATVVCGLSTGCLVTLGLQAPNIVRQVAVEPFLTTGSLWPFIANSRARLARNPDFADLHDYLWKIFGIKQDVLEARDYRDVLDLLRVPTDVLVGELPLLPRRAVPQWPSFTSEEDRKLLEHHPLVRLHQGPPGSGHAVGTAEGAGQLSTLLHAGLKEAARRAAAAGATAK